jgi:hypothetical protein
MAKAAKALTKLEDVFNRESDVETRREAFRGYVTACAAPRPIVASTGDHKYIIKLCFGGGQDPNNCGVWFQKVNIFITTGPHI